MTAGGIILSSRLRNRSHIDAYSALLYFQVFIFTFGFYGIWGQVVIKAYLSSYISADLLGRFTEISMLLGFPFLVFAWLMLIRLACGLSGRICSNWFVPGFLVLNFALIVATGYHIAETEEMRPALLLKIYFIAMNLIYSVISSALIFFPKKTGKPSLSMENARIIAPALIIIMLIQCLAVYLFEGKIIPGLIFILAFFVGNTFLPVYLTYGAELITAPEAKPAGDLSFDEFCRKYDVSPREKDIVREICNGLSNKDIAEKLFISLQTVKDHTHRIYIKTNVKSRAQLMNLVRGETESG